MATFKRLASKRWQAQVARKGIRRAKTFKTKQEANDWAARQVFLISNGDEGALMGTLGDVFDRHAREVSPGKRGARWEIICHELLKRDPIADVNLRELAPGHFADWRDRRLRDISPSSVNREMNLMSGALSVARKEWGWLKANPLSDVRKPSKPPPGDRRVSADGRSGQGMDRTCVTRRFHNALLRAVGDLPILLARQHGLRTVVPTGGVMQNALLWQRLGRRIGQAGLEVLLPWSMLLHDGDIALSWGRFWRRG